MYLDSINRVLDRIEEQLTEDISYQELASMMAMSVYEFRRIFAFVIGTPLSEYIRQRRLSCALFELQAGDITVTELAKRYRYDSPSSFTRAFQKMQGISPSEARVSGALLKSYPRASFHVRLSGADMIPFRLIRTEAMKLVGYTGLTFDDGHDCGEAIWNTYYDRGLHDRLAAMGAFSHLGGEFAAYTDHTDTEQTLSGVSCTVGALLPLSADTPEGMDSLYIPPTLWGVFEVIGAMDQQINTAYFRTLTEWSSTSGYTRDPTVCNLECFPVEERKENEEMPWRIYYPLIPKNTHTGKEDTGR